MTLPPSVPLGPWFRRHPRLAVAAALGLFAGISVLRFATADERDATLLLFVLPIALLAQAFGLTAGAVAAVGSVGVLIGWVFASGVELSLLGWVARVTPLVLLGLLIGHASDAQRRAEMVAARLSIAEERQREAAEINDTIVQSLAVAKWNVESGNPQAGVDALEEVIEASQALVADLLGGLDLTAEDRRRRRAANPSHREGV
jgi:signal transduction histidine kinase